MRITHRLNIRLIKSRMKREHITYSQLAKHLKVSRQTIYAWLHRLYKPNMAHALRLCMFLDITFNQIFSIKPQPNNIVII